MAKGRVIFIPQLPVKLRYQEWWFTEIPKQLRNLNWEVLVIGEKIEAKLLDDRSTFSPLEKAIQYELQQMQQLANLKLTKRDIVFLADISFTGLISSLLLHLKSKVSGLFAFCHATSINKFDLFEPIQRYKYPIEKAYSLMFDKILLGSNYHKEKLGWDNTKVVYVPLPPFKIKKQYNYKQYNIVSASRPTKQKVDLDLERKVSNNYGPIIRPRSTTWDSYFGFLERSRVLLITSHEDTFGYQIIDAILNGCIPIARKCCAYTEIIDDAYLYTNEQDISYKIELALKNKLVLPRIKCLPQMKQWYKTLSDTFEEVLD